MSKSEQQQFNQTVLQALEELTGAVHRLAQGRKLTDDELIPIYKKLAQLGGLMQP